MDDSLVLFTGPLPSDNPDNTQWNLLAFKWGEEGGGWGPDIDLTVASNHDNSYLVQLLLLINYNIG